MKKFIKKLIIVVLPFLIVFSLILYIGCDTGELLNFDYIIKVQRENHDVLIGMGYNEQTAYYKSKNANYYQKDIIALGTSRVMQFKADYFYNNFYNCGGGVSQGFNQYLEFLKNLEYNPKIIILGLDTWVFNSSWRDNNIYNGQNLKELYITRSKNAILDSIFRDFSNGKYTLSELSNYPLNYGFNGRIKDDGFMWDGSYYYGNKYRFPEQQEDTNFINTKQRIENGNDRFEHGKTYDQTAILELDSLLSYCQENGIYVIGFLPPFAPSVYEKMICSGNYEYIGGVINECEKYFNKYDFDFFNYLNITSLDCDDKYFIDGFHGSEVAYAIMLAEMTKTNVALSESINNEYLLSLIENKYSELVFHSLE